MNNVKLIILLAFILMFGLYDNVYASETYQLDSDYRIYDLQDNPYQVDMPPLTYYPKIINYTNTNYLNMTMGNTSYQLNQTIQVSDIDSVLLGATLISGTKYGNLGSYTQIYSYLNTESDYYTFNFTLLQKRGGTGWIDIYAYVNSDWVKVEQYSSVGTSFNLGTIKPESKVNGWKAVCHWELTNRFTLLRPDDTYADGYKFNEFSFIVKDSQQQEEDVQSQIEENTRQTNGILGTIQNKIDAVTNKVQSIVDGISNLPSAIMDGLKDLLIPDDFTELITDNVDDLTSSLGVLGFPLRFVNDAVDTINDNDSVELEVSVPSFGSPWGTLFPGYHRSNILYFSNTRCFTYVSSNSQFSNILNMFGLNYNSTIISCVHSFTNFALFWWSDLCNPTTNNNNAQAVPQT